jgi:hypothetical protein
VEIERPRGRYGQDDERGQNEGTAQRLRQHRSGDAEIRSRRRPAWPGLEATYDVVLFSEFESKEALDAYQQQHQQHPQHVALKPFMTAIREARQCMDYEL